MADWSLLLSGDRIRSLGAIANILIFHELLIPIIHSRSSLQTRSPLPLIDPLPLQSFAFSSKSNPTNHRFHVVVIAGQCIKASKPQIFAMATHHHFSTADDPSPISNPSSSLRIQNLIGGQFLDSQATATIDVLNPATQEVVSQVPLTTNDEFKAAVSAAKQAFPKWRNTPVTTRQRIMFKLQELIRRDMDQLALNITKEQGKTLKDAHGDVFRGLEVVEHACGMGSLQMGEFVSNVSSGIDTLSVREPLGVCAGICPFNFPAMIPLWMFPIAVTCGNTFVLKPSEKDPGASMILAELAMEAGLPEGVLNIVHGTNPIENQSLLDSGILCCLIRILNALLNPEVNNHQSVASDSGESAGKNHSENAGQIRQLEDVEELMGLAPAKNTAKMDEFPSK